MPSEAPIVVAMSGGVDSAVTAALLKRQGHKVIGITLHLHSPRSPSASADAPPRRAKTCCAGKDLRDAQKVARKLDIPHYVLDLEERFQQTVVEDFLQSYRNGETPLPCVRCNQHIKFDALLQTAVSLGAQALATGHYARIVPNEDGSSDTTPLLLKGVDGKKDQSYYLFATTKEQLAFLRFPLGGMTKEQTRSLARELGLANAEKAESQDICFVAKHYTQLFPELQGQGLQEQGLRGQGLRGQGLRGRGKGEIRGTDGTLLGEHEGIAGYTIGQRKGLRLGGLSRPLYVVGIDAAQNRLTVGTHEELSVRAVHLREVNWLGERLQLEREEEVCVKFRSLMEPVAARLRLREGQQGHGQQEQEHGQQEQGNDVFEVAFAEKQYGVACGQACVVYRGERVLGGGIVARTLGAFQHRSQIQSHSQAALEVAE